MAFKWVYPDVDPDSEPAEQPELANGSHAADNPAKQPQDKAAPSVLQKLQKWGDYEAFGDVVRPALFIPMKTPLSKAILSEWTLPEQPKHSLTIDSLLQQQHFRQRQIGMIIDLSNHETLYADDIPPSIQYQHIQLVAKVFPDQCQVDQVIDVAETFWAEHPQQHIAIHCAYGFNRTGFVVCSYLIQALGMSVDEALGAFEEARPPGVKHEKFVAELHRRFDSHRWGSGHSTVGSEAASISGFSQPRSSQSGSVSSLHSDFKGVAEHLHGRQHRHHRPVSFEQAWPVRPPMASSGPAASHGATFRATPSPEREASSDAAPEPSPGISPMSFGSENESLGINQRAALRELRRSSTSRKYEEAEELAPNPSLGMGISELTAALRQQRPRRDISTLPPVESNPSLHGSEATSSFAGASSSPSVISPFAALSHSPHEDSDLTHSLESAHISDAGPDVNANANGGALQSGSTQHSHSTAEGNSPPGNSELSFSHQVVGTSPAMAAAQQDGAEADLGYESASSDGSQHWHKPGRAKCALM